MFLRLSGKSQRLGAITGIYIDSNFVYHGYLRSPKGKIVTWILRATLLSSWHQRLGRDYGLLY